MDLGTRLAAAGVELRGVDIRLVPAVADDELLALTALADQVSRDLDRLKTAFAAEVARRSDRALADASLAARQGHANAESLLRSVTGAGLADVSRRVRVGRTSLTPLARVAEIGGISLDAADAVARALQPVAAELDPVELDAELTALLAKGGSTDELAAGARQLRDTLDRAHVADRDQQLRAARALHRGRVVDGLRRVALTLDPESDAIVMGAIDHALSPRLGGPRFTDGESRDHADATLADERTLAQASLDTLVDLVRVGVDADDGTILGTQRPALRVHIRLDELRSDGRTGAAWVEGSDTPLAAATARRILCDAGALPIVLGGRSEILDLGRTRRLFSPAQRVALAARDGGCRWPGCDRPPSWTEAHHVDHFSRHRGKTDVDDGILLCRRHHMLLHNHGWEIARGDSPGAFSLVPPASADPSRRPRRMPRQVPRWLASPSDVERVRRAGASGTAGKSGCPGS